VWWCFRSLAQGQYGRFGQTTGIDTISGEKAYLMPYGVLAPPQRFAMRVRRYMHEHGVRQEALRAVALASYHHAQANPRAVMYGKPLDASATARKASCRTPCLVHVAADSHGKALRRAAPRKASDMPFARDGVDPRGLPETARIGPEPASETPPHSPRDRRDRSGRICNRRAAPPASPPHCNRGSAQRARSQRSGQPGRITAIIV